MSVVAPHFSSFHVCSVDFYHFRDSEGSSSFDLTTSCGCCAVSTFQAVWYPELIPFKSIYYAMDRVQLYSHQLILPIWLAPQSLPFWVKNTLHDECIH